MVNDARDNYRYCHARGVPPTVLHKNDKVTGKPSSVSDIVLEYCLLIKSENCEFLWLNSLRTQYSVKLY